MKSYRIEVEPAVETDVEAAFDWYEREKPASGQSFLTSYGLRITESSITQ